MSTATILDVAREAQVSSGTVSRVLRGHPSVSPDNLQRVMRAIESLNYAPRHRKASMADISPLEDKNVLLLLLGEDQSLTTLPIMASVIHGVQRAIGAARANLTISDVPRVDHVPEVMTRKPFEGVIIKGALQGNLADAMHTELRSRLEDIPTVWVLGRAGEWGDVVQPNDMLIGKIAAEHLISRGHRRLAFINPKPTHATMMRRQSSFAFFAQQAGAHVTAYLGEPGYWRFPSTAVDRIEMVQGLVDKLLAEPEPPSAIFGPVDSIGATVARALSARGLQAGRDISLMSCNNEQPLIMGVYPTLTTIDVHAEAIGRRAVDQLIWRIQHSQQPGCEVAIDPVLVEGGSVANLNS